MTDLDRIPDYLLARQNTAGLLEFIDDNGLAVSLFDLDAERRRRAIRPPMRERSARR